MSRSFPHLLEQLDDQDVEAVDLTVPDVLADMARLASEAFPQLYQVPPGDIEKLADALANLREVLLHTSEQVESAEIALGKLVDRCAAQLHSV